MASETKHRKLIRYSLIACVLLIQIIILLFFYNEYFNTKKLRVIENQLKETRALKNLTNDSKKELFDAQNNLQKYVNDNDQNNLELYFQALRKLTGNIDSIKVYENRNLFFKEAVDSIREEALNLNNLEILIDSIYKRSQESPHDKTSFEIKNFEIGNNAENFDIEVRHSSDSVVKKKLFARLKDAIKGDVSTKRDTILITATHGNTIDTDKIKENFDSAINAINNHYLNEIKRYQSHISIANSKNNNLYHIYNDLIVSGNNLMEIYDGTINNYNAKLEEQYNEQNSINNKIRRYAVLGLMILLFFVLIVVMYYTKQSFLYERELKAANEEIKRNLNFKNKILSMLSHEIRAPLKIITIFIDRITKKTTDEKIIDYLKSISFTNNSLLIQANQILEYAKNQKKPIELKPIEFNLRNEIDAILRVFQPYIESRKNVIEIRNEIGPKTIVLADNIKIHQVFTNILGNANKFTENGEIKVIVSETSTDKKTVRLYVTVSDTGIGISESDIEKIFEPYYQGMLSNEIDNLGAGLGLNLCKEIIELFHGNISVKSTLKEGTTVNFEIDLNIKNEYN
jgi:Signal transduction histidine kinase